LSFRIHSRSTGAARGTACLAPRLERAFDRVLTEDLSNRVLDFDSMAAATAAQLAAGRQRSGRVLDLRDTLIAGIALARRATIATGNIRHFEGLDVPVVDPWTS
jgi:predicted nucleic acid-binding protein